MGSSISISLPEQIMDELIRFSEAEGVTCSEVVADALLQYMFVCRLRKLRATLVPFAEAQGIYSDDDVFRHLA